MSDKLHPEMIKHLPHLRAFALMLTRQRTLADHSCRRRRARTQSCGSIPARLELQGLGLDDPADSFFNARHRGRVTQLNLGVTTRSQPPAAARRSSSTFATSSALSRP